MWKFSSGKGRKSYYFQCELLVRVVLVQAAVEAEATVAITVFHQFFSTDEWHCWAQKGNLDLMKSFGRKSFTESFLLWSKMEKIEKILVFERESFAEKCWWKNLCNVIQKNGVNRSSPFINLANWMREWLLWKHLAQEAWRFYLWRFCKNILICCRPRSGF